jgi:hypothetical protein
MTNSVDVCSRPWFRVRDTPILGSGDHPYAIRVVGGKNLLRPIKGAVDHDDDRRNHGIEEKTVERPSNAALRSIRGNDHRHAS